MEKLDYTAILADIDAKIAALESAKASLAAAWASGALGAQSEMPESGPGISSGVNSSGASYELPRGALLGKSIPAAIKLYLDATKKKQTIKQIALALKDGGVESTSDNFENIVTGSLNRLRTAGEVLRFKDGWGLTEHYPNHLRKALSQDPKKSPKKKPKSKKTKNQKRKSSPKPMASNTAKASAQKMDDTASLEQKIQNILNEDKSKSLSPQDIATRLQLDKVGALSLTLGYMVKRGKAKKVASGQYQANSEQILSAV